MEETVLLKTHPAQAAWQIIKTWCTESQKLVFGSHSTILNAAYNGQVKNYATNQMVSLS